MGPTSTTFMNSEPLKLPVDKNDLKAAIELLAEAKNGMSGLSRETEQSGKAAGEAAEQHKELWHVLEEMGNAAVPGLGSALAELGQGPLGAALALISAYEMVRQKIEEVDTQAEELSAMEMDAHRQAIENFQKAWDDCRLSLEKYREAVKSSGQSKDPAADGLNQVKAVSAAQTEAHIKELEEQGKQRHTDPKEQQRLMEALEFAQSSNEYYQERARTTPEDANEYNDVQRNAASALEQLKDAQANRARYEKAGKADIESVHQAQSEKQAAETALQQAQATGLNNAATIAREKELVASGRAVEAEKETGQHQIEVQADAAKALLLDKTAADAVSTGHPVSPTAAQQLIRDASAIAGHTVNLQDAVAIIEAGAHNINAFMAQLGRLTTAFGQFDASKFSDLQRKIETLEAQLHGQGYNAQ